MESQFELDEEQLKLKSQLFPYIKALTYEILISKPDNIISFILDFFMRQGNYTSSGLTLEEKKELESLRREVLHYRELELINNQNQLSEQKNSEDNSDSDEAEDVMDSYDEIEIEKKVDNMKKSSVKSQFPIRSRGSVSAEVYGIFNKKKIFVPKKIPKTPEQINRIKGKIISSFIFNSLDIKEINIIIDAMEEKNFKIDETVITQGEVGDCLYIVETGSLNCFKILENGENKFLCTYGPGDAFGELALLYNCPRAASIVCSSEESILWSLDRETFNHIVKTATQNKREKHKNFLKKVDILSTIDDYELGKICDSLKVGIYNRGDYIIKEGEMGDVFYILEEGKCIATKTLEPGKPEEKINELNEGDYFGERALIKGEPRYANIIVTSDNAKVISLDRLSFNRLLGPIMDILKRNMGKYNVYCTNGEDKINSLNDIISNKTNIDVDNQENNINDSNNKIEIQEEEDNNNVSDNEQYNKNEINEVNENNGNSNNNINLNDIIKSDNFINNNINNEENKIEESIKNEEINKDNEDLNQEENNNIDKNINISEDNKNLINMNDILTKNVDKSEEINKNEIKENNIEENNKEENIKAQSNNDENNKEENNIDNIEQNIIEENNKDSDNINNNLNEENKDNENKTEDNINLLRDILISKDEENK